MSSDEDETSVDARPPGDAFAIEDLSCGAQAHGFGSTTDGRGFAFQVKRATLRLEVYREGLDSDVPGPEDVAAVAELSVKDLDLDDPRSLAAAVRDAAAEAARCEAAPEQSTTIHAFLSRLGSVIDGR